MTASPTGAPPAAAGAPSTPRLGPRWRLWPQCALRGPGFPAVGVLDLVPDGLARLADRVEPGATGPAWSTFAGRFGDAAVKTARSLQEIAGSTAFQEALAWQNRTVLRTGIGPFLAWSPSVEGRTSMPRQREELVAHYWQRFCVKNDTIGFFGPVGWGELDTTAAATAVRPGEGLIASTALYFSGWALDGLADAIGRDPGTREWTAPRRLPHVLLDAAAADGLGTVAVPGCRPRPLPPGALAVLRLCDGVRPARAIAVALPGIDVPAVLDDLVARKVVVRRLVLPASTHPERHLRKWLRRIGDEGPGRRGLALLDELERGREGLRDASGPHELSAAMAGMEAAFAAATGGGATRSKGAAPCRALVYSDAVRSAQVVVGRDLLAALAPLELLLDAAAWMAAELAARVLPRLHAVHDRLRAGSGAPVPLATLWFAAMGVLHGAATGDAQDVRHELHRRWAAVLGPVGGRRVHRTGAELAAAVAELFPARPAAWSAARYVSPDVLLVADGPDGLARGEFEAVVGELHVAANTLASSLFVHQHPDVDALLGETTRDHPGPRLLPHPAKEHRARLSVRTRSCLDRPEDYLLALVDDVTDPERGRTVRSADVTVHPDGDALVVELPDGARFPLAEAFAHLLTTWAMDMFTILPAAPHTPRVTVDRCVVARETWRFAVGDVAFAAEKDEARRFVGARRWWADHGLPRFVFVTSPTEPRPFYVDADSPLYTGILAKAVRRLRREDPTATLTVTEMLPDPERTWLVDDQGRRYTAELRFVAVDEQDLR